MWNSNRVLPIFVGLCGLPIPTCASEATTSSTVEQSAQPYSFQREIGTVLTRHGCNSAECHGGVKGRGGLKLSLGGLYPKQDHYWITRGGDYLVLTANRNRLTP